MFLIIATAFGCDSGNQTSETNGDQDEIVKRHYPNGALKTVIETKDGKRHGMAKSYYKNGKMRQQITYVNNVKHGEVTTYYESGNKYQITPYENGKIHGIRKKFRMNGMLMAEIPYRQGEPCAGLKEYLTNGEPKTQYPKIVVKEINDLIRSNQYTLQISISDNSKKVVYYLGTLDSAGCISEEAMKVEPQKPGVLELKYNLGPGMFLMEEMNIVAVVQTRLKNPFITQRKYNLSIENRN